MNEIAAGMVSALCIVGCAASAPEDAAANPPSAEGGATTDAVVPADTVVPACDTAQRCTFAWGDYRFVVDAGVGGRILELSMGGTNVLVDRAAGAPQYGSTFWTSPQADWTWPPPAALDTGSYATRIDGAVLTLTSGSFSVQSHPMTVEKTFRASSQTGVVTIDYAIVNAGASAVSVAPWEVSRVPARGLTFFPNPASGQLLYPPGNFAALPTQSQDNYTFVSDAAAGTDLKVFADGGPKGYLAHLTGDLLFVKAWTDVPSASRAPAEGEIEVYAAGAGTYVELETQGAYGSVAPGGRLDWQVRWSLARVASTSSARQILEQTADGMATK